MNKLVNGKIVKMTSSEESEFLDYQSRTAPELDSKFWLRQRISEYGTPQSQLEYIVEHGIESFIERQNLIKQKHPKKVI